VINALFYISIKPQNSIKIIAKLKVNSEEKGISYAYVISQQKKSRVPMVGLSV
jgi:hypothetical protein